MLSWFQNHGDKMLTSLTTLQLLLAGLDPTLLAGLLGDSGAKWVAFATAILATGHTIFVKPTTPVLPAPAKTGVSK